MDAELKARGVDTLIISGTLTNCCCESTARDALQMGYNVIFLTDANATLSDEEHNATLISMVSIFADVMDTKRLLRLIEHSRALAPPSEPSASRGDRARPAFAKKPRQFAALLTLSPGLTS